MPPPLTRQSASCKQAIRREDQGEPVLAAPPQAPIAAASNLKHCRDWTPAEIAEHFDRTQAAVASLPHRDLKQLRKLLHEGE